MSAGFPTSVWLPVEQRTAHIDAASNGCYGCCMPKPMMSLQTDAKTDAALDRLTFNGKSRSDVIREAIQAAARKPTPGALPGIDLATAKKTSKMLLDLLSMVVTGLEVEDPDSAMELVRIVEGRMRYWRMARQDREARMQTALDHMKAVIEEVPANQRAKVKAGAIERMQQMFP